MNFYFGLVTSPEHKQRLLEVAYWVDQNKFEASFTEEEFKFYAAEMIIHALCHKLRS